MEPSEEAAGLDLEDVFRQLPGTVLIVEAPSCRVLLANRRAHEVAEQLGRRVTPELNDGFVLYHPDGRPYEKPEWPIFRSATQGEEVVEEEFVELASDGRRLTRRTNSTPVYDKDGRVIAAVSITRDVTELKQIEERLAYHARLLENIDDAVMGCDERLRFTAWNKGAERLYGWTAEEVLGLETGEVVRFAVTEAERAAIRRETTDSGRTRLETVAYRKDGEPFDVELINVAVRDERGMITGYLAIHRDITERKRAEEALRESSRRIETILESITDAFCAVDRDWHYTYFNEEAARLVGKTREELIGKVGWEEFPENANPDLKFYPQCLRAMEERITVQFEEYDASTGKWLAIKAYPWEEGLAFYTRDITERKKAEEKIAYHARLLENLHDAVIATDEQFVVTAWNKGAEEMFRWTADEALGRPVYEAIPTVYSDEELKQVLGQLSTTGRRFAEGKLWRRKDGTRVYAEARTIALHGEQGQTTGYLSIMRDITERQRVQTELERRARQQAVVAQLGLRALSSDELQPLLDEAVALVARTLEVEYAGIMELLPGGEELLMEAGFGWRKGAVGNQTELAGRGSQAGYALLCGEPVVVEDLLTETRFSPPPFVLEHGVVSGATVLIPRRGQRFGALQALSKHHRTFSDDDVNFLQAIANVVATTIERVEAEKKLREVRENERRRIARDLHDEALRDLAYALAEAHRAQSASNDPVAADRLSQLIPLLKRVGQRLRAAVYDLRLGGEVDRPFPELLESLVGLHRAMAVDCAIELETREGIPTGPLGRTGTQVLRIVGEALTNARRHSGARVIRVGVWGSDDKLCVEVSDDGRGFDPATEPSAANGTGVKGMYERASVLSADLQIRSELGTGTKLRLELSLRQHPEATVEQVRVLLVEDHAAVREALASAFEREAGFEITGQAASLAEARQMLEEVDVAVIDLALPDGYGGDLIEELREASPHAQALVLTASIDRADIAGAVESGAAGALSKAAHLDQVIDSVRRLRAGEALLPLAEVVDLLRFAGRRRQQEHEDRLAIARLTPREREVLQMLAKGLDSQGIAERLHITLRTERNHIASILAKLGVHSRLQALVFALRYDLVEFR